MKTFLKYLFGITAITLLMMCLLDVLYTKVYETSVPRNKTQYVLQLKNKKIDYVFLGSSRVKNHIVTKIVEKETGKSAINLGVSGGNLDDVYLLLKLLVENNIKTSTIFIQIDYSYNLNEPSKIVGAESLPYIRSNAIVREHLSRNPDFTLYSYIPFLRYNENDFKIGFREFFTNMVGKKSKYDFADGYEITNSNVDVRRHSLPTFVASKNDSYEGIEKLAQKNNLQIVYFFAPLCDELNESVYIDKLKVKIPSLIDFSKTIKTEDLFQDCAHLNGKGAEVFTQMLVDSCLVKK